MSTGGDVPELIGNGYKARAWAEKIVQGSQMRSSNRSRIIQAKRDNPLDSCALAPSLNTSTEPGNIQLTVAEDDSQASESPHEQTGRSEMARGNNQEQRSTCRLEVNPVKVADKVYRLMQKDLLLQIERAGK
jgi:hypothetical protein